MADETGPTERTGTHDTRRVLTADERDKLVALVAEVARTEFRDGQATVDGTSTREQRKAASDASRAAYSAFVDYVFTLTKRPTLDEIMADQDARWADGPRAGSPVEVVAECGEVTS